MGTLKVNGSVNIQDLLTLKSGTDAYTTPSIAFGTDVLIGYGSTIKNLGIYSSNKIYLRPNNGTLGYGDGIELSTTQLIPTKNNTVALGNSTHKWSSIYATTFFGNLSGNADTVDNYHFIEGGNAYKYKNKFTQPTANTAWYLKISTPQWDNYSEVICIQSSGDNAHGMVIVKTGARHAHWWGYASSYNFTGVDGVKKVVSSSDDVYIQLNSRVTSVTIYTTFAPTITSTTDTSNYTAVPVDGGLFGNVFTATTFSGNASSATISTYLATNYGTDNAARHVYFAYAGDAVGKQRTVIDDDFKYNPSTNHLTVGSISGNAATATKLATSRTISLTGSVTGSGSFDGSGNLSISTTTNHIHDYIEPKGIYTFTSSTLPNSFDFGISCGFVDSSSGFGNYGSVLTVRTYSGGGGTLQLYAPYSPTYGGTRLKARFGNYDSSSGNSWTSLKEIAWLSDLSSYLPLSGGTMSGSPAIKFPASAGSIAASDPMAITYGRISAYGTLCINANTDNSGTEYIILTAGKGLSSSTADGLAIGTSTLTWQGSTVLTKRDRGYAYTALSSCYTGGSTPTYYRIIFPDNQVGMWNMVTMELTVRQKYDSGTGGKIIINAYHSSGDWTGFTAYVDGYMSHDIKVYGSGGKYFYISGCGAWSTLSIDKMIISDGAVNVDLTDTTCDYVTSMPSGYSTATMSYGLTSTNYSSYCAPASHSHSYLPLGGGTLTGPLQVNGTIFGYNYANSNNAAAFIWDKNGTNYTGVGSCNTTDMIHFGPCSISGAWVSNYNQIWRFQGGVYATGWLESDNFGTSDPGTGTAGYGRGGAIYFKVVG